MTFHLTDHACRHCGGRILCDGERFVCAECGATCDDSVFNLCWCGVEIPSVGKPFRCQRIDKNVPGVPQVVVEELGDGQI